MNTPCDDNPRPAANAIQKRIFRQSVWWDMSLQATESTRFPPVDARAAEHDGRLEGLHVECGPVAQLGARLNGIQEVTGSIPVRSTKPSFRF